MSVNLFAFDFTEENNNMITDERVLEQFTRLKKMFKNQGNGYYMGLDKIPSDMMIYIDEFEEREWIERRV